MRRAQGAGEAQRQECCHTFFHFLLNKHLQSISSELRNVSEGLTDEVPPLLMLPFSLS